MIQIPYETLGWLVAGVFAVVAANLFFKVFSRLDDLGFELDRVRRKLKSNDALYRKELGMPPPLPDTSCIIGRSNSWQKEIL